MLAVTVYPTIPTPTLVEPEAVVDGVETDTQRWARYRRDLPLIVASRFPGEEAR